MIRPTRCFRPSLDEFEKKTLLSTGQIAHLAHAAPAAVDKFKYYFRLRNLTGHNVRVYWAVSAIGSDSGSIDVPKNETRRVDSGAVEGDAGTVSGKYDGKTFFASSVSKREREPAPRDSEIPLTDLR